MLTNEVITNLDRLLLRTAPPHADALVVTARNLGNVCLLQCAGRIAPGDEDLLRRLMQHQPVEREIVLDMAQVESIDPAGIGTLVALRGWNITAGTGFKLMNLRPQVERLLRATNLLATFHLCTARQTLAIWRSVVGCGQSGERPPSSAVGPAPVEAR